MYFVYISLRSPSAPSPVSPVFLFAAVMPKIRKIEYFRVPPRWLFVKITDEQGSHGWGEATLEGHTQAVEGCLDALIKRFAGFEAEYTSLPSAPC